MNSLYLKLKSNKWSLIILLTIFIFVLILNLKTLYIADDYVYHFFYQTSSPTEIAHQQKISTLLIPASMWNHYFLWNGRFVAHSIVQYFMQFDTKIPFDICNSLIFVVLIMTMDKFASKLSNKKAQAFVLPLIFAFTWFYLPFFGQSVLWVSGAGNYLWMSVIYLGFIMYNLKFREVNLQSFIIAGIIGFLAGASNENSGPAAILIVLLFMIKRFIETHKISLVNSISVFFGAVGFLLMLLSPGSQKRGMMSRTWPVIHKNLENIYNLTFDNWKWLYLLVIVLTIAGIVLKKLSIDSCWSVIFFMVGHFAAVYAMTLSPEEPQRTFFGGVIFLGIALFIPVYALFSGVKLVLPVLSILMAFLFIRSYVPAYQDINQSYQVNKMQYEKILTAKKEGKSSARVPILPVAKSTYNATYQTFTLDEPSDQLMNLWVAKYFDIGKVYGYHIK
ncbi:MAG TPA: DUF6056 family protein [Companilactobacillus farciminis]|uniref:DUF6056 family protein n=1 Tax=Companilactobacillus farciminis TaxID=1612 RepID=A0A921L945_9LACO|nr:DUF6056 family protein [Companilactobacillus farciminis]